jgi:hypothetical protein
VFVFSFAARRILSTLTSLCLVCDQQSLFVKYFQFYLCSFLLLGLLVDTMFCSYGL